MQKMPLPEPGQADIPITPAMVEAGAEYLAALLVDGTDAEEVAIGVLLEMLRAQPLSGP